MANRESPFRFAWVNEGTDFNPFVHDVEDEKIVAFHVEQSETEFALMSVDIKNPRIGLLNAGRKLWAWLSWFNGTDLVPLFYGRVVAIPSSINREVVQLQFIARPTDFSVQKTLLAEYMRDPPFYDPVFISPDKYDDPDVVLEGRTEVWHIDRVTHEVTTSDLIIGEDGVLEFQESEVPYDSVDISFDQPPIRRVRCEATVPWTQSVASTNALPLLANYKVDTLAGTGLEEGWPKAGDSLGGGWTCAFGSAKSSLDDLTDTDLAYRWYNGSHGDPFGLSVVESFSASAGGTSISESSTIFVILNYHVYLNLNLSYAADRKRSDTVIFELVADTQPVVTDPGDDELLTLKISGNDVSLPVGLDGSIPIGVSTRRSFFAQERGQLSLQYLIQLARAAIIIRSRAVKVTFKCSFERAIELSCRKNALLHDRRIPGGQALGKIVGYSFKSDSGEISGECTIACAIGYGGSQSASPGTGCYANAGYMHSGYQFMDNEVKVLGANDVAFVSFKEAPNDDGLVFPLHHVPIVLPPQVETVETKPLSPVKPVGQGSVSPNDCGDTTSISVNQALDTGPYSDWLGGIRTTVNFSMKSVEGGPFDTIYLVDVSLLNIPKQIDLEAPSV